MKHAKRTLAKVNVLSCEPKLDRKTDRQMLNKENIPLWSVDIEEKVFNEKHSREMMDIITYKSLEELAEGPQIIELKEMNMGQGSGDFIQVKTFFTILRTVDKTKSLGDIFSLDGVLTPMNKKAMKNAQTTTSVQ